MILFAEDKIKSTDAPLRTALVRSAVLMAKFILLLPSPVVKSTVRILRAVIPRARIKNALSDVIETLEAGPPESQIMKNMIRDMTHAELKGQFEDVMFGEDDRRLTRNHK